MAKASAFYVKNTIFLLLRVAFSAKIENISFSFHDPISHGNLGM